MTRRLWSALTGEHDDFISRSSTGRANESMRAAWSSHYADRGLLLLTLGWLGLRIENWIAISQRPDAIYEPKMWLGSLVFPTLPNSAIWYTLAAAVLVCVLISLARPRLLAPRIVLTLGVLLLIAPEFGFGHMQHVNHLFLIGHLYSTFRPLGRPKSLEEAELRARGYSWFLLGLLAVYTASGLWKIVDMTIRDVLKPGVTWLEPEAMLATSIAAMRSVDLTMTVPRFVESVAWIFPIGYVLLTIVFAASFLGAFRRPLLLIIVPVIAIFHLLNAITLYALFISTIVVAFVLMMPYDYVLPTIERKLSPVRSTDFTGRGHDARYIRTFENGDTDVFMGFFAYRERLHDRSALLAAPLYYPGIAWAGIRLLRRGASVATNKA